MPYKVKASWWLKLLYPGFIWSIPSTGEKVIYLTFDDGPHPQITRFVLDQLRGYNAKATFFCIGNNVVKHPDVYQQLLSDGHTVGNHTYNHLNGWKSSADVYIKDIANAAVSIDSNLFRPPYGRIKRAQASMLQQARPPWKIYMWDVLSGDFDVDLSEEKCLQNIVLNIEPGSIVVFHDSEKAWKRMSYALPKVLEHCKREGYIFKALP